MLEPQTEILKQVTLRTGQMRTNLKNNYNMPVRISCMNNFCMKYI